MPAWDMEGLVFRKMSQLLSRSAKNSIVEWLHLCDWPLRRVEPAVNWQRQAVQHGCGVAQEKTNDRGDVLHARQIFRAGSGRALDRLLAGSLQARLPMSVKTTVGSTELTRMLLLQAKVCDALTFLS